MLITKQKRKVDTVVQVVAEQVNAAISAAAHQACVLNTEVEDQIPGHQQPPYNHSTCQLSASDEPREDHHWEIPGIINNNRPYNYLFFTVMAYLSKYKKTNQKADNNKLISSNIDAESINQSINQPSDRSINKNTFI